MGRSRSALFRRAVGDYVKAHEHDWVRDALDAVYTEASSDIDEIPAEMQRVSLSKEDYLTTP